MRLLHFAPEPFLSDFFRSTFRQYVTADLDPRNVDYAADITKLPFADASFDMVYASHVLEHVAEDRKAISEIHRVLAPSGVAVLPVPVFIGIETVEYPEPNPHETYHVRQLGGDYHDRYAEFFARVDKYSSGDFKDEDYQLYIHEDRSGWPTPTMPLRRPTPGLKHEDVVPVCYK
jgi:ubiquinone/menaquinone biosynthesis C-methylase UbiE